LICNIRITTQERQKSMATGKARNGKPYAGNPYVRFDEGEVASAASEMDLNGHKEGMESHKVYF